MNPTPPLDDVVHQLFPNIDLKHQARDKRFAKVAQAIAKQPGQSLPERFDKRSDYNAALRLFDHPQVTHDAVLAPHQEATLNSIDQHPGTVLILHDATLLDFSGHTTLHDDLGPIGNGGGRGWIAHQSLAVDPNNRHVFGLVSQILHVRQPVPKNESVAQKRDRRSRESRLWTHALQVIGPSAASAHHVDVADRGADLFEFLQELFDRKRHFVIRSKHNRALGESPSDDKATELLHDRLRGLPASTQWDLHVAARAQKPKRVARLSAVAESTVLRPPHVKKGEYRSEPMTLNAIRVWEADPPAGEKPLEWLLLTNEAVDCPEALQRVVGWYACRMQIEEYHKVQKSGLKIESPQLQSVDRLAPLVALLSVVAIGLMNLRLSARDPQSAEVPATEVVPRLWVRVLSVMRCGSEQDWSVSAFMIELAGLGGYRKNPKKEPPGWIVLWRGWTILHQLIRYEQMSTPIK